MARSFLMLMAGVALCACARGADSTDDVDGSVIDAGKFDVTIPDGSVGCGNTQTDPKNCGKCGNVCPTGAQCNAGTCACTKGVVCSNSCADTQTDPKNCGKCGNVCTGGPPNSTWSCVAGTCTLGCTGSQVACNNLCVDTQNDDQNCGQCGFSCNGKKCCSGQCKDTTNDNANCGSCGKACTGNQTCIASNCSACDGPSLGSCSHNACTQGGKLSIGCDGISLCVAAVCANKPLCCLLNWDASCVNEVKSTCGYSCQGC